MTSRHSYYYSVILGFMSHKNPQIDILPDFYDT